MFGQSTKSEAQPSYFYLMMAESCFHRAASTRNPKAPGTLRDIGLDYLVKAGRALPSREFQSLQSRPAAAH